MARCNDCNKFVSYGDMQEPEANLDFEASAGLVTGEISIQLDCAECGTTLRTGSFEISEDITAEWKKHLDEVKEKYDDKETPEDDREECETEVEVDIEGTTRTTGKGRGMKTFYGYHATVTVKCSCGEWETMFEADDDTQASALDEA